jgi:hypothetical protein
MFLALAIPLALYVVYAAAAGEVWVRGGVGARLVTREQSPAYFWVCIAIYAGLAVAMATIF